MTNPVTLCLLKEEFNLLTFREMIDMKGFEAIFLYLVIFVIGHLLSFAIFFYRQFFCDFIGLV